MNLKNGSDKRTIFELLTDVECLLKDPTNNNTHILRQRICNMIHNHINRNDRNMDFIDKKLLTLYNETTKFLKTINTSPDESTHTYIIQSDKGNVTTLIPKSMYEESVHNLLNNKDTFRIYRQDPTPKIQKTLSDFLDKLIKKNIFKTEEKTKLMVKFPVAPKFYGPSKNTQSD
jgi:hypothetical protein